MFKEGGFNEPTYADLRLVFRSSTGGGSTSSGIAGGGPPAKRRCTGLSLDDERSFYTHRVILASKSPVINTMLLRAKEERHSKAMDDESLELKMEHGELLAGEVLFRSIYSGKLAEEVTSILSSEQGSGVNKVKLLVQVYRLADCYAVCTDQCVQAISVLTSADCKSADLAQYIFSLRTAAPTLADHVPIKDLIEKCLAQLIERFGNVTRLFWSSSTLEEFRQLDFYTVLALLDSDKIEVISENEILTLMGLWMGEERVDRISKEQLRDFSNVLRLGHFTTSFTSKLHVVAPWLPLDPAVLGDAATWKMYQVVNPEKAVSMKNKLQSVHGSSVAWFRDRRAENAVFERVFQLSFVFSKGSLAKLLTSVQRSCAEKDLHTMTAGHTVFNGYEFFQTLYVQRVTNGSKKTYVLSIGFEFKISAHISKGSGTSAHVKADCDLGEVRELVGEVDDFLHGTHSWELARLDTLDDFSCLGGYMNQDGGLAGRLHVRTID